MASGLYAVSVPVFARMLRNLSALLDKMVADATARKIDPAVLLGSPHWVCVEPFLRPPVPRSARSRATAMHEPFSPLTGHAAFHSASPARPCPGFPTRRRPSTS